MKIRKNIVEDYLNYDLSEEDLEILTIDEHTLEAINLAEISDKLSKEFYRPGYEVFMKDKKEEIRSWVRNEPVIEKESTILARNKSPKYLILAFIGAIFFIATWCGMSLGSQSQQITTEEVKHFALLSYESTGAIYANRGEQKSINQLGLNYTLLQNGNCNELTINGKFLEQELWSQLYCAFLNNDIEKIELYKSQIIENKYSNYLKLR